MIIGVISDSHDNLYALEQTLQRLLEHRVELVVHLGDIISPFTARFMKKVLGDTKVLAVKGNNDGDLYQLLTLFTQYGWVLKVEPSVVELYGRKVLLLHGYGNVDETLSFVNAFIRSLEIDVVLYGHTHHASVKNINGKLVLNPGEVCGYLSGNVSYAIVDLKSLKAEIIFLKKEW